MIYVKSKLFQNVLHQEQTAGHLEDPPSITGEEVSARWKGPTEERSS